MSLTPRIDKLERNLLINGNMSIIQRDTVIAGLPTAQYGTDRWVGWFPAAGAYTTPEVRHSSLPAGFPGKASTTRAHRLVATTTDAAGSHVMYQRIEAQVLATVETDVVSFGFWASVDNFQSCTVQLIQTPNGKDTWTGQTIIANSAFSVDDNAGGWQYFKVENISLVNKDGLECRIVFNNPQTPGAQTDTYITEAICNEGSEVKPFNLRGRDEAEEFILCSQFYTTGAVGITGVTPPNLQMRASFQAFPVEMRTIPTMTFADESLVVGRLTYRSGGTNALATTNLPSGTNISSKGFAHSANAGFAAGSSVIFRGSFEADAEL
jgi:hypothetical protein